MRVLAIDSSGLTATVAIDRGRHDDCGIYNKIYKKEHIHRHFCR